MARLDSVLSFSRDGDDADQNHGLEADAAAVDVAYDNGGTSSDDDDAGFEFAFAPPLSFGTEDKDAASADDLFAHGRILPAYPVFQRARNDEYKLASHQTTAPPSPDTYCAWAPRSAPGSPARARGFPTTTTKSASTGEARRFWRLPGLVGGGGVRSHSDGKEKFVFLQPANNNNNKAKTTVVVNKHQDNNNKKPSSAPPPLQKQKQSKNKKGKAVTEMDMATAHRLFYGNNNKQGAIPGGAADRRQHSSYLPYRTGIVGFFAAAHALGKSHHPY